MSKDEIIGRIIEAWDLFKFAMQCLLETMLGREVSCPPCWKCTTMRWVMFVVLVYLAYLIGGTTVLLAGIAFMVYLVMFGEGPWATIRGWVKGLVRKE